jgi:hypothetical protein
MRNGANSIIVREKSHDSDVGIGIGIGNGHGITRWKNNPPRNLEYTPGQIGAGTVPTIDARKVGSKQSNETGTGGVPSTKSR